MDIMKATMVKGEVKALSQETAAPRKEAREGETAPSAKYSLAAEKQPLLAFNGTGLMSVIAHTVAPVLAQPRAQAATPAQKPVLTTDARVKALIAKLRDKNAPVSERKNAAMELGKMGAKSAVSTLIAALDDKNEDVRLEAKEALGKFKDRSTVTALVDQLWGGSHIYGGADDALVKIGSAAVPALIAAFKNADGNEYRLNHVVRVLGRFKDSRAVPVLIAALKLTTNKEDVRNIDASANAIKGLGKIKDARVLPALIAALYYTSDSLFDDVADTLKKIAGPRIFRTLAMACISRLRRGHWDVADELTNIGFGSFVVPTLIGMLKYSKHDDIRAGAAELLGKIKNLRAVPALIVAALKDSDIFAHREAAKALGKIKDPRAVPPLLAALKGSNSDVRARAAEALGQMQDPRAVPTLIAALKDGNGYVRREATRALGAINDPRVVPALIVALKDENVRSEATMALGEIKDPRALPALIVAALKDSHIFAHREAVEALGKIIDPGLVSALYDSEYSRGWVRKLVVQRLRASKNPHVVPALIAAVKDRDVYVHENALAALMGITDPRMVSAHTLVEALKDRDGSVRWWAARMLDVCAVPELVSMLPELVSMLKDSDVGLRIQAARALRKSNDPRAAAALKAAGY